MRSESEEPESVLGSQRLCCQARFCALEPDLVLGIQSVKPDLELGIQIVKPESVLWGQSVEPESVL